MIKNVITLCVIIGCVASATGDQDARTEGIRAFTRPSEDRTLSLVRAGLISKVHVKDGDEVKAGQVLIQLDDQAEQAQLAQAKAEAENKLSIEAAVAELDQKRVELKKIEKAFTGVAATELEVENAKLEVLIKELSLKLARFKHAQAQLTYAETKAYLERMKLNSPIDGRIQKITVDEGEAVEKLTRIIQVVKIDPMEIDVPVPLAMARDNLKKGQAARVVFDSGKGKSAEGRIINIAPVADPASDTISVKIELPNPTLRPPGEHVRVFFPASVKAGSVKKAFTR